MLQIHIFSSRNTYRPNDLQGITAYVADSSACPKRQAVFYLRESNEPCADKTDDSLCELAHNRMAAGLDASVGPPAIKAIIKSYSIKVSTPDCRSEGTGSIPVRIVMV